LKLTLAASQKQGNLHGAICGERALFDTLGCLAFGRLYGTMNAESPLSRATPYLLSAGVFVAATIVAVLLPPSPYRSPSNTTARSGSDTYAILESTHRSTLVQHRKWQVSDHNLKFGVRSIVSRRLLLLIVESGHGDCCDA
jgi:hypothetical protein